MKRRVVEIAVLLFGVAFAGYLAYSFRPGRRPTPSEGREALPGVPTAAEAGQATTVLKGFDYTDFQGGKRLFHIQSDRTVGYGPAAGLLPNLYALEKVTLTVYPETGAPVTVNADRATYDHRTNEAHLNGNVHWVDGRGALGETEEIAFQPSARVLAAPGPVRLTRGTFVLESRSGAYDVARREARLEGPIRGTGTGEGTGGLTALTADRAVYRRDEAVVELEGAVTGTSSGGSRIQADRLVLKTREEGHRFDWARAEGHVRGTIAPAALPGSAQTAGRPAAGQTYSGERGGLLFADDGSVRSLSLTGSPASVEEPARKLRASSIEVTFEGGHARTALARGSVKIESEQSRGESDQATMSLTPDGQMETLDLSGSVRMEGDGRSGRADRAVQVAERGVWVLTSTTGSSATVEGEGSKVSASRIEIDQKRKGVRAEGGARSVLTPKQTGSHLATPVGDSSRPTFGKADRMTFDDASRVATLSGNATLWQGASSIFANDITLNDAERTLVAVGNTRTVFAPAPAPPTAPTPTRKSAASGASERHASVITSRRLVYREVPVPTAGLIPPATPSASAESASTARFDESVVVTSADWRATANQATAWVGSDKRLDRVELSGDVKLQDSKEGRNGRAEHATDWPREGKTILEGNPASVVDREGNRVAGATLTIAKRGGSVEVTAPEGGRTETIHKTHSNP